MMVSDAPNCGVTYDHQSDNCISFILQSTGEKEKELAAYKVY